MNLTGKVCHVSLALQLLVVALSLQASGAANKCKIKTIKHNVKVCVCNEAYCDSMDPIEKTEPGIVQIYESNRFGQRLDKKIQKFGYSVRVNNAVQRSLSVNRTQRYQEIIGFGGSFSDAASLTIGSLSKKLQEDLLTSYFGKTGIEYSVARIVIAGSDFSTRPYTYDDSMWDWDLKNFSFVDEDINYKALMAKDISEIDLKFFASSWAPPAWLKTNRKLNHGGVLNEYAGSIFWQTYAKYLLKFFDGYKAAGIPWWGMTVQNEPATGFDPWFPWNTCGFSAEMERDFVKTDLGPIMKKGGYPPENFTIMVLDHNRNLLPAWADTIFKDPKASQFVKGTGVHWYGNAVSSVAVYDQLHALHPDKFIFATEACTSGPEHDRPGLGNWTIAEEYAHDVIRDLNHWVTGWTDWNLALDMKGGPNWVKNYQSAPIIINKDKNEFYKNPSFYAMGHFSKFLPPKSFRIGSTPTTTDTGDFQVGAFMRPDSGVVVIVINSQDLHQTFTVKDSIRGTVTLHIEPHSFTTMVYY